MRRLILSLVAFPLLVGLLPACSGEADKPLATFEGDGFSIDMPGKPERTTDSTDSALGKLPIVVHTSGSRDKAYILIYTEFPSPPEVDMGGLMEILARSLNGTAQEDTGTTFQGLPARDGRITNASAEGRDKPHTVFLRAIEAKNRLYQLQYVQEGADVKAPPPEYSQFLASFKIG